METLPLSSFSMILFFHDLIPLPTKHNHNNDRWCSVSACGCDMDPTLVNDSQLQIYSDLDIYPAML